MCGLSGLAELPCISVCWALFVMLLVESDRQADQIVCHWALITLCCRSPEGRHMLTRITQLINSVLSSEVAGAPQLTEQQVVDLIGKAGGKRPFFLGGGQGLVGDEAGH